MGTRCVLQITTEDTGVHRGNATEKNGSASLPCDPAQGMGHPVNKVKNKTKVKGGGQECPPHTSVGE